MLDVDSLSMTIIYGEKMSTVAVTEFKIRSHITYLNRKDI